MYYISPAISRLNPYQPFYNHQSITSFCTTNTPEPHWCRHSAAT